MTYLCQSCKHDKVNLLLDVGELPLCNRYLSDQDESECRFPMAIGQCQHCFLVQMVFVVPVHELTPRFSWLSYNEPDAHLDKLACRLCSLPGISKISKIMGISYKDDPLLERFRNRKFSSVWRPDPQIDLGVKGAGAGVETIEELLTLDTVNEILNEHGKADILLIRHIVEHSRDLHKFLTKMKMLVKPQGYMVIEVPDCSKAFQNCDYTTLWEEHIAYFTPATFLSSLHHCALKTVNCHAIPYALENVLIAITRQNTEKICEYRQVEILEEQLGLGKNFAQKFDHQKRVLQKFLKQKRRLHGKLGLVGAGHAGIMFINLHNLTEYIECAIDENLNKVGLFLPGSKLPICSVTDLKNSLVKFFLLSVPPEIEEQVIKKIQGKLGKDVRFVSIFPGSKYFWLKNQGQDSQYEYALVS